MSKNLVLVFLVAAFLKKTSGQEYETIVTIPNLGRVGGSIRTFLDNPSRTYYQYKAIPFAESLDRFALAEPKRPWTHIHNGTMEGKMCPQPGRFSFILGDVDEANCLVLTVTTPQNPTSNDVLPVLIFYHGGTFITGTSQTFWYDPEVLALENILVVQIQYRLGILGWLSDGSQIPKNNGLKDCYLGLQWVHQNIEAFGGDPMQVTIHGESAGSIITSNLWQSPKTNGLIAGAIMQSGTSLNAISYQLDAEGTFRNFLLSSLCAPTIIFPIWAQVLCLRWLPVDTLSTSTILLSVWSDALSYGLLNGLSGAPILEDPSDPSALVVQPPMQQLTNTNLTSKVPVLVSITSEEMLSFEPVVGLARIATNSQLAPNGMRASNENEVGKRIKEHYAGSELTFPFASIQTILRMASDITFNNAFRKFIDMVQPNGPPIFCMIFNYVSPMGRYNLGNMTGHGEDLFYSWKMEATSQESEVKDGYPEESFRKRKQLNRFIANFVKTRNPTPKRDRVLEDFLWFPVDNLTNVGCLDFKQGFEMVMNPKQKNYDFWNDLHEEFGRDPLTF